MSSWAKLAAGSFLAGMATQWLLGFLLRASASSAAQTPLEDAPEDVEPEEGELNDAGPETDPVELSTEGERAGDGEEAE